MTAWQRLRIEATYFRHVRCAVLFHSSATNCCNCLTFLGPVLLTLLPITAQMCSKGSRSGERDGYGSTFTLNGGAHQSASGAYPCYTNHHVYGIKMHFSQFKFVPEFWLKKGNGIILWKIKLDLEFAIRFVSSMLNRPQTYTPQHFYSHNELSNQRKT